MIHSIQIYSLRDSSSTIFGVLASCIPNPNLISRQKIHINVQWESKPWECMLLILIKEWIKHHML